MTTAQSTTLLLLFASMAWSQKQPPRVVTARFSGSGDYALPDQNTAALTNGVGTFDYMGDVQFIGTVHQIGTPTNQICTFQFFVPSTAEDDDQYPTWYLRASGGPQTCKTDNRWDGTQVGTAHVYAGRIISAAARVTDVLGGMLAFNLTGRSGHWTIEGSATLTLPPLPSQTAGPGGSGYPPVVAGPGGSGYPMVINGANAGSVLVFDNDAARPALAHASNAPASIQIPLPVQAAAATYTVTAVCQDSAPSCWIQIPTASGAIAANSGATINANVDPQGLSPGVYSAIVATTISTTDPNTGDALQAVINLPLTAIVSSGASLLGIPVTGLQFQAVAGAAGLSQSIPISDLGAAPLPFSVSSSQPAGDSWLSVFPSATTVSVAAPATAQIRANPGALATGTYFGKVDVSAPGAINSPQPVNVALTVLPSTNSSTPEPSPTALTFVANGATPPAAQPVQLSTLSDQQVPIAALAGTDDGANWLTVTPASGTVTAAQPLNASITVQTGNLQPGVYQGSVVFQSTSDDSTYPVSVQLIVPHPAPCTPTQLVPILSNLSIGSNITAALPVPLNVQILDNCGTPLSTGAVIASFSSGDPAVTMQSAGNGQWSGTWFPHDLAGGAVDVTISAASFTPALSGSTTVTSIVSDNATAPVVNLAGVVSAAAPTTHLPVAPGGLISIFGSNLATAKTSASTLPLPQTLSDTQVLLGGKPMPLVYVSPQQINAVVPFGVPLNTIQQLIVIHNGVYSPPETLVVAPAEPAAFSQDQSGSGAGVIFVVKPDGTQFLNTSTAPASAGDSLVIYCTGLGSVNIAIADGAAAPSSPPAQIVDTVAVSIAGKDAPVSFAGLVPGYVGLYQVNVTVPHGIAPGAVPLIMTVGNTPSPAVTVAIR